MAPRRPEPGPARAARLAALTVLVLTLWACSTGGGGGPSTPKVEGTVSGLLGEPLTGLTVIVHGVGTATTDAEGRFEVEGGTAPYDVTVMDPLGAWAHTFLEVPVNALRLMPLPMQYYVPAVATATVKGELDAPVPPGSRTVVCAQGVGTEVFGCAYLTSGSSEYDVQVMWREGSTADLRLRAVEYAVDPSGSAASLTGSGASAVVTVTEGGTTEVDLAVGVAGSTASFTVDVAAGFVHDGFAGGAVTHLYPFSSLGVTGTLGDSSPLTVFTPRFTGATYTVIGGVNTVEGASAIAWRTGVLPGASVSVEVTEPPTLLTPADGAAAVDLGTVFTVSNPAGGVVTALVVPFTAGPYLAVTTAGTSFTLPDLTEHGLVVPRGQAHYWQAFGAPDVPDMAAAVGRHAGYLDSYVALSMVLGSGGPGDLVDGRVSLSAPSGFTTAP